MANAREVGLLSFESHLKSLLLDVNAIPNALLLLTLCDANKSFLKEGSFLFVCSLAENGFSSVFKLFFRQTKKEVDEAKQKIDANRNVLDDLVVKKFFT
jgi:hypothetical protein